MTTVLGDGPAVDKDNPPPAHVHTTENCPMLRLWEGLTHPLPISAVSLSFNARTAKDQLVPLDSTKRHDTVLDEETLDRIYPSRHRRAAMAGHAGLAHSLQTLERVAADLHRVYRGPLKVRYEDRVLRHLEEARQLVELFSTAPRTGKTKNTPYKIRQQVLGGLHNDFTELLEQLSPLRRTFDHKTLSEGLFKELDQIVADLYRLRAAVGRWRDNPSQKMAGKISECASSVELIHKQLERMRNNSQVLCQEMGIEFFNRAGKAPKRIWEN